MGRKSKPYATMKDGPDAYLFRKDGKQKLVGSADNEICPNCNGSGDAVGFGDVPIDNCEDCNGTGRVQELEENEEGYQYRTETDYEEDNSKIWHYGKAPGEDWEVIDRSPYAEMDDFAWNLYVDFHKEHGRWPNKDESRKIEELEYKVMTKMNDDINEIRKLAGLAIVTEDCDEDEEKNDDGECSPFTHADDNVDMVREDDLGEDVFDEDYLVPPKDAKYDSRQDAMDRFPDDYESKMSAAATDSPEADFDDDDWEMQGGEDRLSSFDRDMSDSEPFSDPYMDEQGPGDDEFDADPDAMVDVGDDEDYEVFDFDDEFEREMGNTMRYESVVEMNELRRLAGLAPVEESAVEEDKGMGLNLYPADQWWKNDPKELMTYIYWQRGQLPPDDMEGAWDSIKAALSKKAPPPEGVDPQLGDGAMEEMTEGEGDTCSRCRKGKMRRGETFFGPAEQCDHCNFQRQVNESAPHDGGDNYDFIDFNDDRAYFLVADEIGDRIIFGMNNEVGIPEQYVDSMIGLLRRHGFEKGHDYEFTARGNPNHIANRKPDMEEDLQNGYGDHEYADSYDDYFPRGSHQSPSTDLGPTAGKHSDNPMRSPMASTDRDEVYEGMRQKYRRYRLS